MRSGSSTSLTAFRNGAAQFECGSPPTDSAVASALFLLTAAAGGLGGLLNLTKAEKDREALVFEERIGAERSTAQRLKDETAAKQATIEERGRAMASLQEASRAREETLRTQIELGREVTVQRRGACVHKREGRGESLLV